MPGTLARVRAVRKLLVLVGVFGLMLIVVLWLAAWYRITEERAAAVKEAFADADALALTFEERTARTLRQIDQASQFIAFEFREHGQVPLALLTQQKGMLPTEFVMLITLVDASGDVYASTQDFTPTSITDREHFRVHVERDTGELYVSKPVLGRVSKRWSVQMTRRLSKRDGGFAGIVVFSVDPAYFANFYNANDFGAHGTLGVTGTDGVYRVRRSGDEVSFGSAVDFAQITQRVEAAHAAMKAYPSVIDGTPRFIAYRRLKEAPLAVTVGLAEQERLASFYQHRSIYLGSAALGTALIVMAIGLLMLQGRRLLAAEYNARTTHLELQARTSELEASERRLQTIADHVPALIAYVDASERYLFANAFYQEVFGIDPRDMMGHAVSEVFGDQHMSVRRHLAEAFQGRTVTFEYALERDGQTRHMQMTYLPEFGADNQVRAVFVLGHDITRRKLAEDALRESEQRLRAIADNLPALICYVDRERHYRFANLACEAYFRRPVSDIIGRPVQEVLGAVAYQAQQAELDRAYAGERVEFDQLDYRNGRLRYLRVIYVPHRDQCEAVIGLYVLAHDITELKAVEDKLRVLSQYDALTGLANRHRFDEQLARALAQSKRSGALVGLMFLDIDQFKAINDTFGHHGGDEVLREFARRIVASVRGTDTVARLAGDEFVVILEGLKSADEMQIVANKILAAMQPEIEFDSGRWKVTTSIGIAVRQGAETDAFTLLREADRALYAAKAVGGNVSRIFGDAM